MTRSCCWQLPVALLVVGLLHAASRLLLQLVLPTTSLSFWSALLVIAQPSWSPATEECRRLRWPAAPPGTQPFGRLRLSRHDQLYFNDADYAGGVVTEPLHIFFRYSGASRHDNAQASRDAAVKGIYKTYLEGGDFVATAGTLAGELNGHGHTNVLLKRAGATRSNVGTDNAGANGATPRAAHIPTPVLGALCLMRALHHLTSEQARNTSVTIMLNGGANNSETRAWFHKLLPTTLRTSRILTAPPGNQPSYAFQLEQILRLDKADDRAIIFLVEEDYLHTPDAIHRLVEFFAAYNPCVASTYDYPDRMTRTRAGKEEPLPIVLKGRGIHWRSVRSVTVTYAARLHVIKDLVRLRGRVAALPSPCCDSENAPMMHVALGIFTPMPGLSTHRHEDSEVRADPALHIGTPDFPVEETISQVLAWQTHVNDQAAAQQLLVAPKLCQPLGQSFPKYVAQNFCPRPHIPYMRKRVELVTQERKHVLHVAPLPVEYEMLDAPAILAVIATTPGVALNKSLVNMGCIPSFGEDEHRKYVKEADDVTPLWHAGYRGINFDITSSLPLLGHLKRFAPRAVIDASGHLPSGFAAALAQHKVPRGSQLDFLKIDIDSFDCDYLQVVLQSGYTPKLIMIKASSWPPPLKFHLHYSSNFSYAQSKATVMSGCSLQAQHDIISPFGYFLLQFAMDNSWFVHREYAAAFGPVEPDLYKQYINGNPNMYGSWPSVQQSLLDERSVPKRMLHLARAALQERIRDEPALQLANYELSVA